MTSLARILSKYLFHSRKITSYPGSESSDTEVGIPSSNPHPIIPLHLSQALPIFRDVPDLSSQVKILGDAPICPGSCSSIWLGELSNGQHVAVKVMIPTTWPDKDEIFLKELYVWLRAMPHENVLPVLGVARLMDSIAFVSPYMPGRSLDVQLQECSIPDRIRILTEISRALAFLHGKNIVYGYLRMSTILLDQDKKAYLSSFLFSNTDWAELVRVDSRLYSLDSGSVYSGIVDDVLAFGLLVTEVLTKKNSLTKRQRHHHVTSYLSRGKFKETLKSLDLPEEIWTLTQACWEENDSKRPTMEQVWIQMVKILELVGPSTSTGTPVSDLAKPTIWDISPEIKRLSRYPIAGGGYCDLYLGERLGKEKVALKLIRLFGSSEQDKNAARRRFLSETQIWSNLYHPRILEFYGICDYGTLSMYMVSPFLSNGNIMDYLNKVNPHANRRKLLVQAAEGLVYLHNRDPPVIHGDLKGGNILISDSGHAVLADFGLSRISHEITSSLLTGAGSPRWMAPELMTVDDIIAGPLRTLQSDVYGYGQVMLEVLSNEKPFFNIRDDLRVVVELLHRRRAARPAGPIASQWLNDINWAIYRLCTDIDPELRPSMNDVLRFLHEMIE